jgi:hypothetical protein
MMTGETVKKLSGGKKRGTMAGGRWPNRPASFDKLRMRRIFMAKRPSSW